MKLNRLKTTSYGKLPFYKEYIRFGEERPESKIYKTLIDKGEAERRNNTDPAHPNPSSKYLFLFVPDKGRKILVGDLISSSDGLRQFPFTQFSHLPRRKLSKRYHLMPLFFEDFWIAADSFLSQQFNDIHDFHQKNLKNRISSPTNLSSIEKDYKQRLSDTNLGTLYLSATSSHDEQAEINPRILRNLWTAIKLETEINKKEIPLAFWVPVYGNQKDRLFYISCWLQIMSIIIGKHKCIPSIFITDNNESTKFQGFFILFRYVMPSDFAIMMAQQIENDMISNLSTDWGPINEKIAFPASLEDSMNNAETSLSDFLNLLKTS